MKIKYYLLAVVFLCQIKFLHSQKLVSVISETITVNSTTSMNGWTRNTVEVTFPKGTIGYVYRVSVFDLNSVNISDLLFDLLKQIPIEEIQVGASFAKYAVANANGHAIDYFILTTGDDRTAFYNKNDNNWSSCKSFLNRVNTCASSNECINSRIYFGFRNNNLTKGLDVYIEIVAIVDENNTQYYTYGYRITNESNTDLEFELSSDNVIWTKYSLRSAYFNNYNFNTHEIYFRISTNGSFKSYKLDSSRKYKIAWNSNVSMWDLFSY